MRAAMRPRRSSRRPGSRSAGASARTNASMTCALRRESPVDECVSMRRTLSTSMCGRRIFALDEDHDARARGDVVVPRAGVREVGIAGAQVVGTDVALAFEDDEQLLLGMAVTGKAGARQGANQHRLGAG